jgi:hypothetical protein
MSATNRGAARHPDDFYATPYWCVDRLLEAVPLPLGLWLEPWAGDGAIVRAVQRHSDLEVQWLTNELSADRAPEGSRIGDYRSWRATGNVVLSNPPYKDATECAEWAISRASTVALLLRLNWLEGQKRAAFHKQHPSSVYVLPNRPSFTGRGTDATAYAWFVWGMPGRPTVSVLNTTPRSERLAARSDTQKVGKAHA